MSEEERIEWLGFGMLPEQYGNLLYEIYIFMHIVGNLYEFALMDTRDNIAFMDDFIQRRTALRGSFNGFTPAASCMITRFRLDMAEIEAINLKFRTAIDWTNDAHAHSSMYQTERTFSQYPIRKLVIHITQNPAMHGNTVIIQENEYTGSIFSTDTASRRVTMYCTAARYGAK